MKIIYSVFLLFLICNAGYAQIDYSYFKQTWCKCMPDSGVAVTDTLTYRIKSEACKTKRYSDTHVYTEHLEYTFKKKNSVTIYESSGNSLRRDYVKKMSTKVTYKTNAAGDTIQIDSTYHMKYIGTGLSGGTLEDFKYKLNKSKNRLTIFHCKERNEYEVLFLSSKMMLLRKINK